MAWIESHQSLGMHPKLIDLADRLGVSWPTAVGHLHYLWWWALDATQNGIILVGPKALATVCHWRKSPRHLLSSLVGAGWVDEAEDGTLSLHNWNDYAGNLIRERAMSTQERRSGGKKRMESLSKEERQALARKAADARWHTRTASTPMLADASKMPGTVPYSTVPYPPLPSIPSPAAGIDKKGEGKSLKGTALTVYGEWTHLMVTRHTDAQELAYLDQDYTQEQMVLSIKRLVRQPQGKWTVAYWRGILEGMRERNDWSDIEQRTFVPVRGRPTPPAASTAAPDGDDWHPDDPEETLQKMREMRSRVPGS